MSTCRKAQPHLELNTQLLLSKKLTAGTQDQSSKYLFLTINQEPNGEDAFGFLKEFIMTNEYKFINFLVSDRQPSIYLWLNNLFFIPRDNLVYNSYTITNKDIFVEEDLRGVAFKRHLHQQACNFDHTCWDDVFSNPPNIDDDLKKSDYYASGYRYNSFQTHMIMSMSIKQILTEIDSLLEPACLGSKLTIDTYFSSEHPDLVIWMRHMAKYEVEYFNDLAISFAHFNLIDLHDK